MKNLEQIINNSKLWYLLEIIEINWNEISKQPLPQTFIEKHKDKLNWCHIFQYQKLDEEFIEKYIKKAIELQSNQTNLPKEYAIKIFSQYFWRILPKYQKLSESFIEKYKDKLDWKYILRYQKLSESFMEKYKDKIDWKLVLRYRKLSKSFYRKV